MLRKRVLPVERLSVYRREAYTIFPTDFGDCAFCYPFMRLCRLLCKLVGPDPVLFTSCSPLVIQYARENDLFALRSKQTPRSGVELGTMRICQANSMRIFLAIC